MNDDLDTLSDEKLSEVFAVEIAGFDRIRMSLPWEITDPPNPREVMLGHDAHNNKCALPSFATDANAVLPWLEAGVIADEISFEKGQGWHISAWSNKNSGSAWASTFARAACIALIRAHRASQAIPPESVSNEREYRAMGGEI